MNAPIFEGEKRNKRLRIKKLAEIPEEMKSN